MSLALITLVLLTQTPEAKAEISYEETTPDGGSIEAVADGGTAAEAPASFVTEGEPPAAMSPLTNADGLGAEKYQEPTGPTPPLTPEIDPAKAARGRSLFRGALEVTAHSLPSGTPLGQQDLYANVLPIISVDTGDAFGFELGAVLRLRVFDDPPAQRAGDFGGLLRGADWDDRSDFGQILRDLWLGAETAPVRLRAGPLRRVSLGRGLLVSRYSNQLNPDYHPLGAVVSVDAGPIHAQVLASDVLSARLFAVEVTGDIADFMGAVDQRGRYHFTASAGHDFGSAGTHAGPPLTVMVVEADAQIYEGQSIRSFAYGAVGSRLLTEDFALGAALGLSADGELGNSVVGLKLEGRKLGGGFRFAMFGPSYELARYSDIGFTQQGLATARLPDAFSGYIEAQLELGRAAELSTSREGALVLSAAAEYFTFNRLDVDASVSTRLPNDAGTLTARFTMAGFNQVPRYQGSGELRYRFSPSLYAIAHGGLVFFPQPDQTLQRGFFAGVGVGADFSH